MSLSNTIPHIPTELLIKIFAINPATSDLLSLCLVCRHWTLAARIVLYTDICFTHPDQLTLFHYCRAARRHIRSIHFKLTASVPGYASIVYCFGPATLAGCTALRFLCVDAASPARILTATILLDLLHSIEGPLENIVLKGYAHTPEVTEALAARPTLRSFAIEPRGNYDGQTMHQIRIAPLEIADLEPLTKCTELKQLDLRYSGQVTDEFLRSVVFKMPRLKELMLGDCTAVTEGCFVEIAEHCPLLRQIWLWKAEFGETCVETVGRKLVEMKEIWFRRNREKVIWVRSLRSPFTSYCQLLRLKHELQGLVWRASNFAVTGRLYTKTVSVLKQIESFDITASLIADTHLDEIVMFASQNEYPDDTAYGIQDRCERMLARWTEMGTLVG